jgi:hypothetical protein
MMKLLRLTAICLGLAFALMLYSAPVSLADGPRYYCMDSSPTDGGDGHPWDDGTGQESTPGDDGTIDPLQVKLPSNPDVQPALIMQKGLTSWTQRVLVSFWFKVRQFTLDQKTVSKAAKEYKTKQSRPMN